MLAHPEPAGKEEENVRSPQGPAGLGPPVPRPYRQLRPMRQKPGSDPRWGPGFHPTCRAPARPHGHWPSRGPFGNPGPHAGWASVLQSAQQVPRINQDKPSDVWAQPVFVTKGHVSSSMVFTGRCFSEQLFLSQVPLSGFMLDNSLGSQFAGLATEAQGTSGACPVTQWVRPGLGLEPITWLCDLCSWPALQTASLGASYPLARASWAGCTPFLFPTHQAYL